MLGNRELPKSVGGAAPGGRAAIFALALAATGLLGAIGSAQAQDCKGGYRMLKGAIPVACEGFDQSAATPTAPVIEPLHTGSINGNANELPAAAPLTHMNGMKCAGGYAYRPTANESYITMPMPCN